jgi:hypothetical protein
MIQLMFAMAVQRLTCTPVSIESYCLPEWGLGKPASLATERSVVSIGHSSARADVIAAVIDRYKPRQVDISYVILRASNLLPRLQLFPLLNDEGAATERDELYHRTTCCRLGIRGLCSTEYQETRGAGDTPTFSRSGLDFSERRASTPDSGEASQMQG